MVGILYLRLTCSRMANPPSIPTPLYELSDDLFALSNELLNMISIPKVSRSALNCPAIASVWSSDSITLGPATAPADCRWLSLVILKPVLYFSLLFPNFYECTYS